MVEAQAAARVDRLGQMKNITIYRYVVKNSIEEVRHAIFLLPAMQANTSGSTFETARGIRFTLPNFRSQKSHATVVVRLII